MGILFEYEFPNIMKIDDVLPHVADSKEFVKIETDNHLIIDYVVQSNDTFPAVVDDNPEAALHAAIRRECRGIAFDINSGTIVSRPFAKFFNVGERDFTAPNMLPDLRRAKVHRKVDGSMIRPLWIGNNMRLATRKGITEVAMRAEECLVRMPSLRRARYERFIENCWMMGFTPIFEFVSPDNRIVIYYDHGDLVLVGLRNLYTGQYLDYRAFFAYGHFGPDGITTADRLGFANAAPLDFLMEAVREDTSNEGVVIQFPEGGMVKIKSEWYCNLHRTKSALERRHDLFTAWWTGAIDDLKPLLTADMAAKIDYFEQVVLSKYGAVVTTLASIFKEVKERGLTKKEFALDFDAPVGYKRLIFRVFFDDDPNLVGALNDFVERNMRTPKGFEKVAELFELNDDTIWPEL